MVKKTRNNQIAVLQWLLTFIQIMGAYRIRKNIFSYFTLISILTLNVCIVLETILTWENIQTLKKATYFPLLTVGWVKAMILITNANKIFKIVRMLEAFWKPLDVNNEVTKRVQKIYKAITVIAVIYMCFGYILSIGLILLALAEPNTLIFSNLAVCNLQSFYCWLLMFIWQCYCLLFQLIPAALSFDLLFMILTAYICVACLIFNIVLRKLNTNNSKKRNILLKQLISQHNIITDFVNAMNDLYTMVMLIQFGSSLCSLTLFPYMMVADGLPPKPEDGTFYGLVYIIITFQIYIYGFGGGVIEEQVKSLAFNIYDVEWYESDRTQMRKDLAFMIFRAQNTKVLNVGKLWDLNIMLFMTTVRNSFSVFTLIWQLSDDSKLKT